MGIGQFRSVNMNLNYRNPDKIDDYRIKCWGFVPKFGKMFLIWTSDTLDPLTGTSIIEMRTK